MGCTVCSDNNPDKNQNKLSKKRSIESDYQVPTEFPASVIKVNSPYSSKKIVEPYSDNHINRYIESLHPYLVMNCNMRKSDSDYDHFYNSIVKGKSKSSSNPNKIKRINSEMKLLMKNLPLSYTNSIFLLYNETQLDLMKSMIVGSDDTPYANGLFIFDIYLDDHYPVNPPKMTLITTGNNSIRFNPNLYTNGYVCLSLLGTWSGDIIEKWNSEKSNILQILLSIQSIVMSEGVYFNEPGYSFDRNSEYAIALNNGYSNIVKYGTIKYGMNDQIKKMPKGFENIIRNHFIYKKNDILKNCYKWLEDSNNHNIKSDYNGLVGSHNSNLAHKFKNNMTYSKMLLEEIQELEKLIEKLENGLI